MPPSKVRIERISGDRTRQNTFHKRKLGLIKKAIELTVLCDCDCAIILRSGPTVTCREGRLMAYCNKDLEKMLKSCLEHPPADYFTNASYSRFSKDGGIVLDEGDAGGRSIEAAELDADAGASGKGDDQDGEDASELKQRMKMMEEELNRLRAMVPQPPSVADAPSSVVASDQSPSIESTTRQHGKTPPSRSASFSARKQDGGNAALSLSYGSDSKGHATPQSSANGKVKEERQSSSKKRPAPAAINPFATAAQLAAEYSASWNASKRHIRDYPAENLSRIGGQAHPLTGEKQQATEALQAALFGAMNSTNVAEPPSTAGSQSFPDAHAGQNPFTSSSDMAPTSQPHSGAFDLHGDGAHRPPAWSQFGFHPQPGHDAEMQGLVGLSQPPSGGPLLQPGSWPGMQGGFSGAQEGGQLAAEDGWDQWQELHGWSPAKAMLPMGLAQPSSGSSGPPSGGHTVFVGHHLPEGSPKH